MSTAEFTRLAVALRSKLGNTVRGPAPLVLAVLVACYAIKRHYSTAGVEELTWMLGPTVRLVELLTGLHFGFEAGVGYTNTHQLVSVTAACAGVNFLLIAWTTLLLCGVHTLSRLRLAHWALCSLGLAYVATLIVNSLRIVLAIHLHREHRAEGIAIYLGATCLLYACGTAWLSPRAVGRKRRASGNLTRPGFLPALATPVALYLGVTLVVPALNGAAGSAAFWEHATVVLVITGALLLGAGAVHIGRSIRCAAR